MIKTVQIWDEVSPINGVEAEVILANRDDLRRAHGDIFLVMQGEQVCEIQIGKIIAANFDMEEGLSLQEIADAYMVKKQEEEEEARIEKITNEELQEEVAILSYDVMVLQAATMNGGVVAVAAELEEGEHSPKFNKIKVWFNKGFWTKEMVGMAVHLGHLSENERIEIIGE